MTAATDPTLRRLVNGVLWPGFTGLRVPEWLARALDEGLAGVVYFGHNINEDDAEQPARLSAELRGIRPEVLIGIDEEGGNVSRLDSSRGTLLPGHAQLGGLNDPEATEAVGRMIGRRAASAGANIVLAPVADVNTNPANPVIGVRAFGRDTGLVARHVAAFIQGLQDSGVAACVKHFPGHGDTHTDSHLSLPRLDLSWAEIERDHLPPFHAAVAAGVRAVMTAHIVVPERGELPATLNPGILTALRETGFAGTIVTDALDMAAIRASFGAGPGAVLALAAGAELLCIGNPSNLGPNGGRSTDQADYLQVRGALFDALDGGVLTPGTLERAGRSAARLGLPADLDGRPGAPAPSAAQQAIDAALMVRSAITVRGAASLVQQRLALLDVRARATLAVASTTDTFTTSLSRAYKLDRFAPGTDEAAVAKAVAAVPPGSGLAVLVDRIASAGAQREALARIAGLRPDAVVINAGLPSAATLPLAVIDALGSSRITADTVSAILQGGRP
ncbi:glycoside hydrolase family 3 N-terminal domain-containing protein [Arthrobacter sp. AL08]|uniref:glycoside hydrolase family 3 N-terminal domain-containing protein n=1 Tax=unclassified Arthrobacter TaxID=235627 RepID=UPI001CFF6F79|nr:MULTISPECIES: glycoside hydrolase family 3 N-terminal domain-containing protein [unclassified Arthrobacter]MCB5282932.1 Beta-hexosaminidase [Arthrobacter sp. ES1]MDI3242114.1 glycoside hydrolase family 3 N-terminal domain-containing protein [Arthrobacter sp. AL05]MDI3277946.1 glycoside hydrolase family 3 N-terminal domain-containing protein [Arthrobacter sp. AL08]WGZ79442.1 glycoside hydrolase family 3 N-terminal domain-containing protein [Arthrobacter sp. EM1]